MKLYDPAELEEALTHGWSSLSWQVLRTKTTQNVKWLYWDRSQLVIAIAIYGEGACLKVLTPSGIWIEQAGVRGWMPHDCHALRGDRAHRGRRARCVAGAGREGGGRAAPRPGSEGTGETMSENNNCKFCDKPMATTEDHSKTKEGEGDALCWRSFGTPCEPIDWRARALGAEESLRRAQASDESFGFLLSDVTMGVVTTLRAWKNRHLARAEQIRDKSEIKEAQEQAIGWATMLTMLDMQLSRLEQAAVAKRSPLQGHIDILNAKLDIFYEMLAGSAPSWSRDQIEKMDILQLAHFAAQHLMLWRDELKAAWEAKDVAERERSALLGALAVDLKAREPLGFGTFANTAEVYNKIMGSSQGAGHESA